MSCFRTLLAATLLTTWACTPEGTALMSEGTEAGVEPMPDAGPPAGPACELGDVPIHMNGRAGGRLLIPIAAGVEPSELTLDLPDAWRATIDPDRRRVTIRTSAVAGNHTLTLRRTCAAASAELAIEVEISAPFWSTVGQWTPGLDPPGFQQLPELWVDPAFAGRVLMFGGFEPPDGYPRELWSFNFERALWEMQAGAEVIPDHASGRVAPVAEGGAVLFLDGLSGWPGSGTNFTLARIDYGSEGTRWTTLAVQDAPPSAAYAGAFVLDRAGARYIAACGLAGDEASCDVGAFDPVAARWSWPTVEGEAPAGRYGFSYAFDEETRRLILFSGAGTPSPSDPVHALGETWALELGATPLVWVKLETGPEPPPRRNACFALDAPGHRLLVWGGSPDAANIAEGMWALDSDWGHESWARLDLPAEPPVRSSCSAAADPTHDRVLFGFGNTRSQVFFDLNALNL